MLVTALPALVLLPSVINRAYSYAYKQGFSREENFVNLQGHNGSFAMFEVAITFVQCSQKFSTLLNLSTKKYIINHILHSFISSKMSGFIVKCFFHSQMQQASNLGKPKTNCGYHVFMLTITYH